MAAGHIRSALSADATLTVRLAGDIDDDITGDLRTMLVDSIMRRRSPRIVVDVSAVTALTPGAIGTLRAARHVATDVHLVLVVQPAGAVVGEELRRNGLFAPDGTRPGVPAVPRQAVRSG